jgi:hypothetical protein
LVVIILQRGYFWSAAALLPLFRVADWFGLAHNPSMAAPSSYLLKCCYGYDRKSGGKAAALHGYARRSS